MVAPLVIPLRFQFGKFHAYLPLKFLFEAQALSQ